MPATTTRTEIETREIPFETRVVRDPKLPRGSRRIDQPGVPGEQTLRYLVTVTNGQPTDRRLIDATVTRQPQQRVVAFGSRRECGHALHVCVPLGRSAICPDPDPAELDLVRPEPAEDDPVDQQKEREESLLLETQLAMLDAAEIDSIELTC